MRQKLVSQSVYRILVNSIVMYFHTSQRSSYCNFKHKIVNNLNCTSFVWIRAKGHVCNLWAKAKVLKTNLHPVKCFSASKHVLRRRCKVFKQRFYFWSQCKDANRCKCFNLSKRFAWTPKPSDVTTNQLQQFKLFLCDNALNEEWFQQLSSVNIVCFSI